MTIKLKEITRRLFMFSCLVGIIFASLMVNAAMPVPAPPQVAAKNYLLIDFNSGQILAEKNSDVQVEPASITKLMTAYVIYNELEAGRLKMDELVTISEKAWRMGGSRMYVEVDSKVSVESLLKGLIIQSGNDASVALAEYIAGSESAFVSMMNQYAADLGMTNTNYVNSTGWPHSGHRTTARDIITLSAAIIREFPDHYKWYSEKDYKYNNIKQYNRNKLLWRDNSVDGLKTGHTDSAGYCLVSSAKRSDMRLISAVLGTKSEKARSDVSRSLLNYGFRFYETHKLYSAGEALHQSRIWRGEVDQVSLGISSDLHITIPRGSYKRLKPSMDIDTKIEAPVEKGSQLGVVRIILNKKELSTTPLVALESVEEGNIFQLAKDYIISLFI
jgi:D-alanyl-D-alanine carboxypeptidase (penicillin-binding protein 5/6)